MIAEFIKPHDVRWVNFLAETPHDVYHLPVYTKFCAQFDNQAKPVAFYAEDGEHKLLAPLLVRKLPAKLGTPDSWCDAVSPYGYSAPLITPSTSADRLKAFLEAFVEVGQQAGLVTAFFRMHPLLSLPANMIEILNRFGCLVYHGQTVYSDVTCSPEMLRQQTRENHRRSLRKLTSKGFTTRIDDWSRYDEFIEVYHMTMRRVGASESYMFPERYFTQLKAELGDALHLCTALAPNGETAAAAIFTEIDGIVQYHLGGSHDAHSQLSPLKLVLDEMCQWASRTGQKRYHLGGGVGGRNDSLFNFKAGFSDLRAEFHSYRMIIDQSKYTSLAQPNAGEAEAVSSAAAFFPFYRRA